MMAMKRKRAKGVDVELGETRFNCEWADCVDSFKNMPNFITHMTSHLSKYYELHQEFITGIFDCYWRDCGSRVAGNSNDFKRHVYFHAFHVKIKNVGLAVIEKSGIASCQMDNGSRNVIPELPERLHCGWSMCENVYDNPEHFYLHMDMHAMNFPDGNHPPGGCKCQWEGCDSTVKNKYKLREHLRSHTQEKMIACPVCGALFCNRTKFMDHLKRQGAGNAQCYECSHCNKRFSSERLLRDHMRHHVNHYKCPNCDMTCPTPSGLRSHLRYRHTDNRPFQCDQCDYSCKSSNDLRKHMDSHSMVKTYQCHVQGCEFRVRSYQSLTLHFKTHHEGLEPARYSCHVCDLVFRRGHQLTLHLKRLHKFKWPSGHSRFRYKPHEDGFLRLQTVRYESVELMDQMEEANPTSPEASQSDQNQENMAPPLQNPSPSQQPTESSEETNTASGENKITEELSDLDMSYNLEMLGDVALHGPSSAVSRNARGKSSKEPVPEMLLQNTSQLIYETSPDYPQIPACQSQVIVLSPFNQGVNSPSTAYEYSSQMLLQGCGEVLYQSQTESESESTGQISTTVHPVQNIVNITETDGSGNLTTRQVMTLSNVGQSSFQQDGVTYCVPSNEQTEVNQYIPTFDDGSLAQGYVVCSSSTDFMGDDNEKACSSGAEMDILKLQQTAADYGIAIVDNL